MRQDAVLRRALDDVDAIDIFYTETLDTRGVQVVAALQAVASAPEGAVVVHCFVGKDRTGIVSALLLRLAGVPEDVVAEDYALSGPLVGPLVDDWIAAAADEHERAFRRRVSAAPAAGLLRVLTRVRERGVGRRSTCSRWAHFPRTSHACESASSADNACGDSPQACLGTAAAAVAGALRGDGVGQRLELVGERLERLGLVSPSVREGARQQPVGEPRVPRQQADRAGRSRSRCRPGSLRTPTCRRFRSRRPRAPGAPLRDRAASDPRGSRNRPPCARSPGSSSHSSSTSPIIRVLACDRLVRKEARPRHPRAVAAAVAAPEQLVAAAHGEQRRHPLDGRWRARRPRREVGGDQRLLAILAATDVEEVGVAALATGPRADAAHVELWPRSAARRARTAMLPRSA